MKKSMEKWLAAWSVLSLTGVLLAGCGSANTSAPTTSDGGGIAQPANQASKTNTSNGPTKTMRIGIGLNEESTEYKGTTKFKELAEKYTNGTVQVQLFPSGQLGADLNMTQQLQSGALESTIPSTSPVANIVPEFSVYDFPFIFKDEKVADQVLDGPFGQKMLDKLSSMGIVGLGYWENGFRDLTNSKREIKSIQDLNGIKLRVMQNPVHIDFWKALGANPTPMSFDQVFNALQQNVIDGQENPLQTIYSQKIYEVQKYLTLSHHVYTPFVFLVSKIWWDGLTPDQQQGIKTAAVEAGQYQRKINRDESITNLEAIKKKGVQVDIVTDDARKVMEQKVKPVIDKYAEKYVDTVNQLFDAIKTAESK
jgi:tripartite ATP-independent transporter DctP family solute receptor